MIDESFLSVKSLTHESDITTRYFDKKELNGALLPQIVYNTPSKIKIKRDLLIKLLEEEDKIRKNEKYIELFDVDNLYDFGVMDENLRLLALKNILPGHLRKKESEIDWNDAFKAYNLACGQYINDVEVKEKVVWMKYDKTRIGDLKNGDPVISKDMFVYDLNGKKIHFDSLISKELPTVMVCGSLTWPPFRAFGVDALKKFNSNYANKINLVVIYISEAHAKDEWPLSNKFVINQHKNIEERISAAKKYIDYFDVPYRDKIYIDSFEKNSVEKVYSCWPERGYVFNNNIIEYVVFAQIEDLVRWPEEIQNWLTENIDNKK